MFVEDLGTMAYRDAWAKQEAVHAEVCDGAEERLLLVEHPPVITMGRRPGVNKNIIAPADQLAKMGVEVVESDRGGDVTFHGPGQIVAYPIVRLIDHKLSVGAYVRVLEEATIAALKEVGIAAQKDDCAIGVWAPDPAHDNKLAKVCALGVRIRRGVSMHGIAVNVTTDLRYFNLIIPCGLTCRRVTSVSQLVGDKTPSMTQMKELLSRHLLSKFAGFILATTTG